MSEVKQQGTLEYVRDLNQANMERFNKVYDFFARFAEDNGGAVKYVDVRPQSMHANIAVEVSDVDLRGDDVKAFVEILRYVDIFGITQADPDRLTIEAGVKCVWEVLTGE